MPIVELSEIIVRPAVVITNDDIAAELIEYTPQSWTSAEAKQPGGFFHLIMRGFAEVFGAVREQIAALKIQTRIATATDGTLDTVSKDFFGLDPRFYLPRNLGESDDSYRDRIVVEILREKATIPGIIHAVEMLTGAPPAIFEPFNALSASCWGGLFNSEQTPVGVACYGSASTDVFQNLPGESRATTNPNPGVGTAGDLGTPYTFYVTIVSNPRGALNSTVQALVNRIRALGVQGIVSGGVV